MLKQLWLKYNQLPFKVRMYIGISTMAVAYFGDRISSQIIENNKLEARAKEELRRSAK
ncbi:Hypothetical protein PAS_chr2-1_0310 [Komagataella phaffii GS115]|uniref:Uncharacterized protein n=1 Tax=Komagataella phaffii (strain GS115 / ATCC 20864) TaxID=644223 RepID=C4R0A1_KOMPG|nr:Hypothetical protein PAS_chr2-1_0310 [Komagataella phaffii GS115]CAY68925.1 Hypothetical protein PAS_chr2-1_0310 [Komagataella phaffii GS115]